MANRYIAALVAYDGTDWSGSQRQTNGPSVQGELERALGIVLQEPAPVVLAGRTDAGVHAAGQCFRFATSNRIPAERVPAALNGVLDRSVRVRAAREVEESFHPRFSARSRVYRYVIDNGERPNPLLRRIAGPVNGPLDVVAMKFAAGGLVGRRDFKAWQSAGSPSASTVRTLRRFTVRRRGEMCGSPLLQLELEADGFLYQMVRNLVGALIKVGQGALSPEDVLRLTEGLDRTKCPPPAPPQGLCLMQVKY